MTEINVTHFINQESFDPIAYSASIAEIGEGAGRATWQNAIDDSSVFAETVQQYRDDIISHFVEYGAWGRDELEDYSEPELAALLIQDITSEYRELESVRNGEMSEDQTSGCLYQCEIEDSPNKGDWYFYLGM